MVNPRDGAQSHGGKMGGGDRQYGGGGSDLAASGALQEGVEGSMIQAVTARLQ